MSDYIDRAYAIGSAISGRIRTLPTTEDGENWIRVSEVRESLLNIPSADVQPVRHGKWEERKVSDKNCIDEWQTACCSVCHKYHTTPYMYYFDNYNYCPNCGARMDGAT